MHTRQASISVSMLLSEQLYHLVKTDSLFAVRFIGNSLILVESLKSESDLVESPLTSFEKFNYRSEFSATHFVAKLKCFQGHYHPTFTFLIARVANHT